MQNTFLSSLPKELLDRKNSCQLVSCLTTTAAKEGKKDRSFEIVKREHLIKVHVQLRHQEEHYVAEKRF